jgi:hypothetical protein
MFLLAHSMPTYSPKDYPLLCSRIFTPVSTLFLVPFRLWGGVEYPDLIRFVSVPIRLGLGFSLHLPSIYTCTFGDYHYIENLFYPSSFFTHH